MIRCEHCGNWIENPEDTYTYRDRSYCEPCAGLMHAEDYSRPAGAESAEKGGSKSAKE